MKNNFFDVDFLILVAIFLIFWILIWTTIFSILEQKKIEKWKETTMILSDLKFLKYDR